MAKIDYNTPLKSWKNYSQLYCPVCKKTFYRENVGVAAVCNDCDGFLNIKQTWLESKEPQIIYKKEELSHIRTLPNGQRIGVTNKGNILDSYDANKEIVKRHRMMKKQAHKFATRSDFKDL